MLANISWLQLLLALLTILLCIVLMGVILLQKGRGGGLSGAFGGGGGSSAFGSKTGDVLTWFTVALAGGFLLLTVVGNYAFDKSVDEAPQVSAPPGANPNAPVSLADENAKQTTTQPTSGATPATGLQKISPPPIPTEKPIMPPATDNSAEEKAPPADASPPAEPPDDESASEGTPASPEQP